MAGSGGGFGLEEIGIPGREYLRYASKVVELSETWVISSGKP